MVIWFLSLGTIGLYYVSQDLSIFNAINPMNAVNFVIEHPFISFIMLADVILATTGGEAAFRKTSNTKRLDFCFCCFNFKLLRSRSIFIITS